MTDAKPNKSAITIALTGASGAPYGLRLIQVLANAGHELHLMISDAARVVLATEQELQVSMAPEKAVTELAEHLDIDRQRLNVWSKENWFSPVASGSSAPKQMVICPCSTGTLSAVAHGGSDNLIERAADVILKERGKLIMVPRETPYSLIHLKNMVTLTEAGAVIIPASPGFYHKPNSIEDMVDFVVARIIDHLGIDIELGPRWGYERKSQN
jgi:flavin prenyltransferase